MSRSTFALALFLFVTFSAIFTSAAPTDSGCGGPKSVPAKPDDVPTVDNSTVPTNSTNSGDDTSDDSDDTFNLDDVDTLATSATVHSGTATWFEVGLGACGYTDQDSDFIVALAQPDWGNKANCNKKLQITNSKNGRVKTATVRDLCPSCPSGNLDLSPGLFVALADDLDLGVFTMTWKYV